MTPRLFAGMMIGAVASVIFAFLVSLTQTRFTSGAITGEKVIPSLQSRANDAHVVRIVQGDKTLTLERRENAWSIKERNGFPARAEPVRALIVQLSQAQLVEKKTRNEARYALLELEAPGSKDVKSKGLTIEDKAGKALASVVVGKKRYDAFGTGKNGFYVRRPGQPQTWLASGDVDVTADIKDWVDRNLLSVESPKITHLRIEHGGGETIVAARKLEKAASAGQPLKDAKDKSATDKTAQAKPDGAASPELRAGPFEWSGVLPEGKKLKGDNPIEQIARAFSSLEFDDVRKAASVQSSAAGAEVPSTATIETSEGLTVTLTQHKVGTGAAAESWVTIAAIGKDKAADQAALLMKKVSGWEFKLPAFKATSIYKRKSDLFEATGS